MVNPFKSRQKKIRCKAHRQERYLHAINGVIDGKFNPAYATYRWEKLKAIK